MVVSVSFGSMTWLKGKLGVTVTAPEVPEKPAFQLFEMVDWLVSSVAVQLIVATLETLVTWRVTQ